MKKKIVLSAFSIVIAFMANSCAPSTPASRISQNPAIFENLPSSQKELVLRGQIKKGMHKDGVLLAWGKPDGLSAGSRSGKSFEKWIYTSASPVYVNNFHHFAGYRFGRHRFRGRGWGPDFGYGVGFGPDVYYVQRTAATVEFDQNNKVSEWMTRR